MILVKEHVFCYIIASRKDLFWKSVENISIIPDSIDTVIEMTEDPLKAKRFQSYNDAERMLSSVKGEGGLVAMLDSRLEVEI